MCVRAACRPVEGTEPHWPSAVAASCGSCGSKRDEVMGAGKALALSGPLGQLDAAPCAHHQLNGLHAQGDCFVEDHCREEVAGFEHEAKAQQAILLRSFKTAMMHKAQAEARGEGVRARGEGVRARGEGVWARGALVLGCHVSLTARVCKVEAEPQLNGVGRRAHRRFLV